MSDEATTDLQQARQRLTELADVCETRDTGDGVMETPRDVARQLGADLRAVLATTPGDDRGRELGEEAHCVCDPNPGTTDGPRPECPRHGIDGETLRWLHAVGVASVGTLDELGEHLANRDAARALAAPAETEAGDEPTGPGCAACGMGGLVCSLHPDLPPAATTSNPDACPCGAEIVQCPTAHLAVVSSRTLALVNLAATPPAPEGGSRAALIPSIEVALFTQTAEQHACLDRGVLGGLVHRLLERWAGRGSVGVLHRAPHGGIAPFVCCGLTPPDLPEVDRITWTDDLVTCSGTPAPAGPRAEAGVGSYDVDVVDSYDRRWTETGPDHWHVTGGKKIDACRAGRCPGVGYHRDDLGDDVREVPRKSVSLTCRGCSAPIVTVPDDDGRVMCPGCRTMHPAPAGPQAEGAGETEVRRVLADRGYRGDNEPVHVLLSRVLDELGARPTDPYGTGDGSYPEPPSEGDTAAGSPS